MLCINDLHVGVRRVGGTTINSQGALKNYLRNSLKSLLNNTEEDEVVVNGDLFDNFTIDTMEVFRTAIIFMEWFAESPNRTLYLIAGNHDWNPRADQISSFHFLIYILGISEYRQQIRVYDRGLARLTDNVFCIPHMPNQELFDAEIEKVLHIDKPGILLLHCNYRNGFAENNDHSLNLGENQVGDLMRAGWKLVLGHEHIPCEYRSGNVIVVGNQFPTSVVDCVGNDKKYCLLIKDDLLTLKTTWDVSGKYDEIDWRNIDTAELSLQFISVTGEATCEEAAEVIKAIAKLRQEHDAFVIANLVKIKSDDISDSIQPHVS